MTALERAVARLLSLQRADGAFEGKIEGGVLFNAATVIAGRLPRATPAEVDEERELELARHLLRYQLPAGLATAFPGGPPSREATRLLALALERVVADNRTLRGDAPQRETFVAAAGRARSAIENAGPPTRELFFEKAFRIFLERLEQPGRGIGSLGPSLAFLAPPLLTFRDWTDGVIFPFVSMIGPLGLLLLRAPPGRGPSSFLEKRGVSRLVAYLLDRLDATGAFFYSAAYSELLIAALERLAPGELPRDLEARARAAVARLRSYVAGQEVRTGSGERTVQMLGSDLWDTVSVGVATIADGKPSLPGARLETACRFVLDAQMPDGAFSFGQRSFFTDADTTGWSLAFLLKVKRQGLCLDCHPRIDEAVIRGLEVLRRRVSPSGGFGAWGNNHLFKLRGTVGEIPSTFLDLPAEEVTGRALNGLGELRAHYAEDSAFRSLFGQARQKTALALVDGALRFLNRQRDPTHGLWPARWSLGFLPATAFVMAGLQHHPFPERAAWRQQALETVTRAQNADGGFGEAADTDTRGRFLPGTPSDALHTTSALSVLYESGMPSDHPAWRAGVDYLLRTQRPDGEWKDVSVYTCFTGFYYQYQLMTLSAGIAALRRATPPSTTP